MVYPMKCKRLLKTLLVVCAPLTAFCYAILYFLPNTVWWQSSKFEVPTENNARQHHVTSNVPSGTKKQTVVFMTEDELLKNLSVDCKLADFVRNIDVIIMKQSGTGNVTLAEYKRRRAESFMKKFANPFRKNPNLPELKYFKFNRRRHNPLLLLNNPKEEINETEITKHLDSVKKARLAGGDDDISKIPEVIKELNQTDFKIPNIVHFVYFGCLHVRVDHFIALLGALRFEKPSIILFHTNCEPAGPYWDAFKAIAKNKLKIVKRSPPQKVWDKTVDVIEHKADVARLEIMLEVGGIYLDSDSVIVKSLNDLRRYEMVLGEESDYDLGNGIIIANKDIWFLKRWYWEYKYHCDNQWGHSSVIVPWSMWKIFPLAIHVVKMKMLRPNWEELNYLFHELMDWNDHYTMHLYSRFMKKYDGTTERPLKQLAVLNTTYGEVARHVIWGDKRIRDVTEWIMKCNVTEQLISLSSDVIYFERK